MARYHLLLRANGANCSVSLAKKAVTDWRVIGIICCSKLVNPTKANEARPNFFRHRASFCSQYEDAIQRMTNNHLESLLLWRQRVCAQMSESRANDGFRTNSVFILLTKTRLSS